MGLRGHVLPSPEIKQLKLKNDFPLFQKIKGPSNTKSTNVRSSSYNLGCGNCTQ